MDKHWHHDDKPNREIQPDSDSELDFQVPGPQAQLTQAGRLEYSGYAIIRNHLYCSVAVHTGTLAYLLVMHHLESCTPGQDLANLNWYRDILVRTNTYQYMTSTRIPHLYETVGTSTY